MKILVISDTHIPRSAHDLPDAIYKEIENVDMIVHAGDFVEKEVYDKLKSLRELKAVCGNMDSGELGRILKNKEVFEVEKFKIGLIHGYGAPANLVETVKSEFKDADVIIFGHSHSPMNEERGGILFFNPGSPTDKIFARNNTYGILEITPKKIEGKIVKI
ncbi:MAG: metallophosphoesterase family protein [Candidatus Omnitrophica bacterium]|nr:metallophosphoesterase family protein [Candidatus Omnitrophota bacterium]